MKEIKINPFYCLAVFYLVVNFVYAIVGYNTGVMEIEFLVAVIEFFTVLTVGHSPIRVAVFVGDKFDKRTVLLGFWDGNGAFPVPIHPSHGPQNSGKPCLAMLAECQ